VVASWSERQWLGAQLVREAMGLGVERVFGGAHMCNMRNNAHARNHALSTTHTRNHARHAQTRARVKYRTQSRTRAHASICDCARA
jgi:hypothetical protein